MTEYYITENDNDIYQAFETEKEAVDCIRIASKTILESMMCYGNITNYIYDDNKRLLQYSIIHPNNQPVSNWKYEVKKY